MFSSFCLQYHPSVIFVGVHLTDFLKMYSVQLGEYCRWFHWQCVLPVSPPACPYCVNQLFKTSYYFISYLRYVIFIIILNVIATDFILTLYTSESSGLEPSISTMDLSSLLFHLVIYRRGIKHGNKSQSIGTWTQSA